MKTTMKIATIALIAIMMVMSISTTVLATNFDAGAIIQNVESGVKVEPNSGINSIAGKIIGLIRNVAVVGGIIILSIIGVKFMIGSAEEKAEYKKSLIPLVVGIIIVMAASTIISMIFGFMN